MTENVEKKEGSMLIPFLVGGLVGAAIALLLAPKSGKQLRKDLADIAEDTRGKLTSTVEKGKGMYHDASLAVKNAVEAGKVAFIEEKEKHREAV